MADRPAGVVGPVWAMARPRRCPGETELVRQAAFEIGADGSTRAKAAALAEAVAVLAVGALRDSDDFGALLEVAAARIGKPAVVQLASDARFGIEAIVMAEAVKAFEARGCRHLAPEAWARADRELTAAVRNRLFERLRTALK